MSELIEAVGGLFEFLIYRVELKASRRSFSCSFLKRSWVPNLPCGVESDFYNSFSVWLAFVPNLPCGVERYVFSSERVAII